MTSKELREILVSAEYRQDLQEMSSYLASIKQERPIVYCLAKQFWKRGIKFQLEAKLKDLVVNGRHIEFKFSYDCDMERLDNELKKNGAKPLEEMWKEALARRLHKSWHMMSKLYQDMCEKDADMFVWVICSRDLRKVQSEDRTRICWSLEQCKWNARFPDSVSDRSYLNVARSFLEKLQPVRPFAAFEDALETGGDPPSFFPSVYHLFICDFSRVAQA